jgi:hypothetical protein
MTTEPTTAPKPRRRWLQFSLRTVMVIVLMFGCGMGWFAYELQQAQRQRDAVEAIRNLEGLVAYDYQVSASRLRRMPPPEWARRLVGDDFLADVVLVDCWDEDMDTAANMTDAELILLQGFPQLEWLRLNGTRVTDAGLVHLRGLTRLQCLSLEHTSLAGAGLVHLRGLRQLRILDLTATQVTDAGLEQLGELTQLQELILASRFTDAGLRHLRALTRLQRLSLAGQFTDAGLVHLRGLTRLRVLSLDSTQLTDVGVNELQKALPNLTIYR